MAKTSASGSINPLPSLVRASAWDAANSRMRKANRTSWNRGDYNEAARVQERLIRSCYSLATDQDDKLCYIRFQIAEQMQRAGHFDLHSNFKSVFAQIDSALAA